MSSQSTQSTTSQTSPQHLKLTPFPSFIAGFAGGSASTILLYPLDLVKVRLQVDERSHVGSAAASNAKGRTICTTVRGVIKHEGYTGLYRGLTPAVIGSAASWGGFFILYEEFKRKILYRKMILAEDSYDNVSSSDGEIYVKSNDVTVKSKEIIQSHQQPKVQLGPMEHFAASCMAGACLVVLTNPLWLIKTRLQLQNSRLQEQVDKSKSVKPPYKGLTHAAYTIVQEEGFLALYKGSIPALMLVSHGGIQFVSYEFLKSKFARPEWKKSSGPNSGTIAERLKDSFGYLVMGATSKFIASTTTYPIQVVKSRLQQRSQAVELSEISGEIIVSKREYSGVLDCVGKILKNEGIRGFFKGCLTNAIRVAPSAAITFVVYEWVLDVLSER